MEFILILIMIGVIAIFVMRIKNEIQTSPLNSTGTNAPQYLRFEESGLSGGIAYLVKRDPYIHKIVSIEAHQNIGVTYTPDKTIYTGVTVGGVTTGGFDTIKGGYSLQSYGKTGEYYLWHKYVKVLGSNWTGGIISSIVLTPSDFDVAQKDSILKKYIVTKEQIEQGEKDIFATKYKKNSLVVDYMSKSDCQYLLSWLCNE